MVWTVITFLLLVFILAKWAWKPILEGLEKREKGIRDNLDRAEKSQKEAETLCQKYETQLGETQKSIQEMMSQARADGEKTRAQMVKEAKDESDRVLEKGRKDLERETERLKGELKSEIAGLSLLMTEKVLEKTVEKKVVDDVVRESLKNAGGSKE